MVHQSGSLPSRALTIKEETFAKVLKKIVQSGLSIQSDDGFAIEPVDLVFGEMMKESVAEGVFLLARGMWHLGACERQSRLVFPHRTGFLLALCKTADLWKCFPVSISLPFDA